MRIYFVTALLSLTLLYQVWGAPKTYLVETKDDHKDAGYEGCSCIGHLQRGVGNCMERSASCGRTWCYIGNSSTCEDAQQSRWGAPYRWSCQACENVRPHRKNPCGEPTVKGLCHSRLRRWTYNKRSGKCKKFNYGGCRGNGNNFKSKRECENICGQRSHIPGGQEIWRDWLDDNFSTNNLRKRKGTTKRVTDTTSKRRHTTRSTSMEISSQVTPVDCRDFTKPDQPGPFFREDAYLDYKIAPASELSDKNTATLLAGKILDSYCKGVSGATVDVWYAGLTGNNYTFPPAKLWYRGRTKTKFDGSYKFVATFPVIYTERPILHYHFKVTTPGTYHGKELVTQAYFENMVPPAFQRYMRGRDTQLVPVEFVGKNKDLVNGGRSINFNIILQDAWNKVPRPSPVNNDFI